MTTSSRSDPVPDSPAAMQLALRRSEERFRKTVENAPNAFIMVTTEGRIAMVNAQTEALFGYDRGELIDQPVEMLLPKRFRANHPAQRAAYLAAPRVRPMGAGRDLYGRRKDGREVAVEIGLNPVETEDGPMVLASVVDISDRKQKEARIEAALKEKDVLLGEIHHRVKNNLQIIHSLLDMQSSRIRDPAAVELLRQSQNRIRSMSLIHQTLYQSNNFAAVDFAAFLDTLVPNLAISYGLEAARIRLDVQAEAVELPLDLAIPCGLAVNELITNALKHAFPGDRSGHITISAQRLEAETVVISVADDGIGLPEDNGPGGGATLGLMLVDLLADQLGARLDINRRAPTRFTLSFSLGRKDAAE